MTTNHLSIMYGLYRRPLHKAAITCCVTTLCAFVSFLLMSYVSQRFIGLYMFASVAMSASLVFSSLAFNRRDTTLMRQLPISAATKTLFYIIIPIIFFPCATQGLWWGLCIVAGWVTSTPDFYWQTIERVFATGVIEWINRFPMWFYICISIVNNILTMTVVLAIVICTRPERRTLRAVMTYVGLIISYGLIPGLIGFILGVNDGLNGEPHTPEAVSLIVNRYLEVTFFIIGILSIVATGWCVRVLYRHFSRI